MLRILVVSLVIAFCLLALPAFGAEGRIPVWQSPTVIVSPGQYVLTRNLPPSAAGGPVIDILSPDVDLDLNGFTVDNTLVAAPAIHTPVPDRVRIHNGFIRGGSENIAAPGGGTRLEIEGIKAFGATGVGFYLFDTELLVIRDSHITSPGTDAIQIGGGVWKNGQIERNVIKHASGGIVIDSGSSIAVRLNQLEDISSAAGVPTAPGIQLINSHGILVEENTIQVSGLGGIELAKSTGCKLYNNVIKEVTVFGILIDQTSTDNYLLHNVVTGTLQGEGILVDGARNHLDDNLSNLNGLCGIQFTSVALDNVYRKNMARGNNCPAIVCAVVSTSDFCDDGVNDSSNNDNFLPFAGM